LGWVDESWMSVIVREALNFGPKVGEYIKI
jgi:hypothetical protein